LKKFSKHILENVIKAEQIKDLRTNMDTVAKFSCLSLIDEGFIKKKAEDGGKWLKSKNPRT
jgi:hypothetical protein